MLFRELLKHFEPFGVVKELLEHNDHVIKPIGAIRELLGHYDHVIKPFGVSVTGHRTC